MYVSDHYGTVSVEALTSQIQLIKSQSETRQEMDLVQRVSDLCVYVKSFQVLTGNDSIPNVSSQKSSSIGSLGLVKCLSRHEIAIVESETRMSANSGNTSSGMYSNKSLTEQNEASEDEVDTTEQMWEEKVATVRNNQRRGVQHRIEDVCIAKDEVTHQSDDLTVNSEERANKSKLKGSKCLKKPYSTKKIKCKKIGATHGCSLFQGKDKTYRVSKASLIAQRNSSSDFMMKSSGSSCNQMKVHSSNSFNQMKCFGSKKLTSKSNLSLLITPQSRDSLRCIAATVLSSQEKLSGNKPIPKRPVTANKSIPKRPVTGNKPMPKPNIPGSKPHNARTSEFKLNLKKNPSPPTLARKTLITTPRDDKNGQRKCTNEQIKRRLERGYDKLRRVSENRRDVVDVL